MTSIAPDIEVTHDPRMLAFLNPKSVPEIFGGIVHGNQIYSPDPFDVETIHGDAREIFARLVIRGASDPPPQKGKSLLLLGEAGSGKTHLIRSLRNSVHEQGIAYCGYLQMNTRSNNYPRYILSKLIDSLEQDYQPGKPSGLNRLANGLLDSLSLVVTKEEQDAFVYNATGQLEDLAAMVERFANITVQLDQFKQIDLDVIRAVLWLLPNDTRIHQRVLKWLRCEDLSDPDRKMLGGLVPRAKEEDPLKTIDGLGRLMAAVHHNAMVIFVDQLEEMIQNPLATQDDGRDSFRRSVNALIDIIDGIPTAIAVVACLGESYEFAKALLSRAKLDRLEEEPRPIWLSSRRSLDEVREILARRLEYLYVENDAKIDPDDPIFPFKLSHLEPLAAAMRPRDILVFLRNHHEECIRRGEWFEPGQTVIFDDKKHKSYEDSWNDYLANFQTPVTDEETELAGLLGWAIKFASMEMPPKIHVETEIDGRFVPTEVHLPDQTHQKLLVAICEKNAKGGGLGKQVVEVGKRAGEIPAIFVRSTPFPTTPNAVVTKQLLALVAPKGKGRRVEISNSDWRAMAALRAFHGFNSANKDFDEWRKSSKPLTQLKAIEKILDLSKLLANCPKPALAPKSEDPPAPPAGIPKPPIATAVQSPPSTVELSIGRSRGALAQPIEFKPSELKSHMAFLGGSGSGKTTAALTLIEQLILCGIPAVIVDRKGDLSRYADPLAWVSSAGDARAAARAALHEKIDVALFTPGNSNGRPLTIPIAPADFGQMSAADRDQIATFAASSIWGMMGNPAKAQDPKRAILGKAIDVFARIPGKELSLTSLRHFIADRDDALLTEVDGFDDKHFGKLAEMLQTLAISHKRLFEGGSMLDIDLLLGRNGKGAAGRARLSIINTQSLGDATDFWIAQFLIAVGRWAAKNSTEHLQAVFLFDEADQYLPATRSPASKAPMENLLRRARSAGLGLFLATQSPGDFDYKCRDQIRSWLIGRVKEQVAIGKLKPMLEAGKVDAASKLPGQKTGEFYLCRDDQVVSLLTDPSLIETKQLPEDRILELARAQA